MSNGTYFCYECWDPGEFWKGGPRNKGKHLRDQEQKAEVFIRERGVPCVTVSTAGSGSLVSNTFSERKK